VNLPCGSQGRTAPHLSPVDRGQTAAAAPPPEQASRWCQDILLIHITLPLASSPILLVRLCSNYPGRRPPPAGTPRSCRWRANLGRSPSSRSTPSTIPISSSPRTPSSASNLPLKSSKARCCAGTFYVNTETLLFACSGAAYGDTKLLYVVLFFSPF
jgi:hypothetical protein